MAAYRKLVAGVHSVVDQRFAGVYCRPFLPAAKCLRDLLLSLQMRL